MKKALMVMGLAMCATMAFAQTNMVSQPVSQAEKMATGTPQAAPVDYKASIFTKVGDTIVTWEFDDMTGFVYGNNGKVLSTDVIGDSAVGSNAHSLNTNYSVWQHIPDSAYIYSDAFATIYPTLSQTNWMINMLLPRISSVNVGNDNGFMLISLYDQGSRAGNYNAYVAFPAQTTPANAGVVDVAFLQCYANFYDQCFIDYKVNGQWKTREINIDGVDVDINSIAAYRVNYTMPLELASQPSIEIRIRSFADGAGAAYGYMWAIDNVSIIVHPDPTDRWYRYAQKFVDGAYGTIPQGMNLPLTWASTISNTGNTNQTGVNVTMSHIYFDESGNMQTSQFLTSPQGTIAAGNPIIPDTLIVDERGFWMDGYDLNYQGWFGLGHNYGATTIPNTYGKRGFPTSHAGINYMTTTATSSNGSVAEWDTILYRVSDATEEFDANSNMIEGYRWGHDNGLIPSGSQYVLQWTADGYITEEASQSDHWSKANFMVLTRYVTGDVIPEGWVVRGVEMIPATTSDVISNAEGSQYTVEFYSESYSEDGENMSYNTINTGVNNIIQEVSRDQLNVLETGYITPGQDYTAINVLFPEQPELLPNTAYRIGYSLSRDGAFGVASTAWSYTHESGSNTAYYNNEGTAPYYYQFSTGNPYDVLVYDPNTPTGRRASLNASMYRESYPMIRLIVGPRMDLPSTVVYAICNEDTGYVIENVVGDDVCGEAVSVVIGSNPTFYVIPTSDHMVIDSIYIDGRKVTPYTDDDPASDENCFTREYNVYNNDSTEILLYRNYYGYMFENVQAAANGHSIKAFTSYHEFNEVGIDPVAANISLGLQPNPATSQVKLNIKGVSGMVNCNIIDMSGRVVYNANINAEQAHTINLSNVPAGAYFVRVTNDTFSKVEKLIVR